LVPAFAIAETVSISGKSYSLMLRDSVPTYVQWEGTIMCRFNTNGELQGINTGAFRTNLQCYRDGVAFNDEVVELDLGNIDSDRNGIQDICEKEKSGNVNVTGSWCDAPLCLDWGTVSGSMVKERNSQHGYYNLLIKNFRSDRYPYGYFDVALKGDFYTGVLSGSCNYSKLNNSMTCTYTGTFDTEGSFPPEVRGSFWVVDDNTVMMSTEQYVEAGGIRFVRSSNKYSATIRFHDGNLGTPLQDYQKWYLEIWDRTDTDRDRIPNLSDTQDSGKRLNLPILPLILE
jgi:hypothetical protein